ncbi:MAG: TonB C-terminal domain-containing protein [Deltaproteobacteria bacterium]|nr:TonB C-terminal domain-containing protein [Deltaproteobacteria bacterium]
MSAAYMDIVLAEGLDPRFKWTVLISVALHVAAILVGLIIIPEITSSAKKAPPIYTVNLISIPKATAKVTKTRPVKKSMPKTTVTPAYIPPKSKAKLVPVGPVAEKPKKKTGLKKIAKAPPQTKPVRRVDSGRDIEAALSRIQREVAKKQQADQRLDSALAKVAEKVESGSDDPSLYSLQGTGTARELESKMRDYLVILYNVIQANWNMPPASLIKKKGVLEAVYIIEIAPSGQIRRAWFERKSGDKFFDQSTEKAVARSVLPPLPDLYKGGSFEVGLRFTPTGLINK